MTDAGSTAGFRTSHPGGLWILFFSELWERFSFYGMRALLVLYMTSEVLKYPKEEAYAVYGAYGTLVYAFPILGGYLADKFLGYGKAVVLGGVLMALGHFMMAYETEFGLYCALGLLCVGNGFFKPNISSTVGKLYVAGDPMRDGGFTIFYMGINIGAFTAPLICGYLGETFGWSYGFGLAGVGMLIGLVVYLRGQKLLEGHAEPPDAEALKRPGVGPLSVFHSIWVLAFLLVPLASLLIKFHDVKTYVLYAVGLLILWMIIKIMMDADRVARERIMVFLILWVAHTGFWMLFEQAGSSLTIFADENTNRAIGFGLPAGETPDPATGMMIEKDGGVFPTTWFQAVNPIFIVLLAPLFTLLWAFLDRKKVNPTIPMKFGIGVVVLACGYLVLVWGAQSFAAMGVVPFQFLIYMYMLHTMGELCLSPVGLSAVTKLAPQNKVGFFMGAWFLSISYAHHFAGMIAGETDVGNMTTQQKTDAFSSVYANGAYYLLGAGILLMVGSRLVNKLAHGVR